MKIKYCLPIFFIFVFISVSILKAQKWLNVLKLSNQSVFIDTSNLKSIDNQISVLCLISYAAPQKLSSVNENVSTIKTQVLFNTEAQKYTVIGNLYYDNRSKIVGESNLPAYAISSTNFSVPIKKNPLMTIIYNKCLEVMKTTLPKISISNLDSLNTIVEKYLSSDSTFFVSKQDSLSAVKTAAEQTIIEGQKYIENAVKNNEAKFNEIEMIDTSKSNVSDETINKSTPPVTPAELSPGNEIYDTEKETNPKGTIFTDGKLYCFQVSSWKNLTVAEREAAKLKREGHNAFIQEAEIPHLGKWYRVRIGYFYSLRETEAYMKTMNKN